MLFLLSMKGIQNIMLDVRVEFVGKVQKQLLLQQEKYQMKLYKSKDWLYRRYVVQKKTMEEIAKECGVTVMTIYRALKEGGLIK